MAETNSNALQAQIDSLRLKQAQLDVDDAEERHAKRQADKEARARRNKQNMRELQTQDQRRRMLIKNHTHRQGSGVKKTQVERGGKGASCLKGVLLPDNRRLVMCSGCPLRVFEPRQADGFPKPRKGETTEGAKVRVERYALRMEKFEKLWEESQDQLTEEAGNPMDCGLTFEFQDGQGNRAHVPSPCDSYAQGLDNREGRAA